MKKNWILATSIGIFLGIGSLLAVLVFPSALTVGASGKATDNSRDSGAIVIAWNRELLHIV